MEAAGKGTAIQDEIRIAGDVTAVDFSTASESEDDRLKPKRATAKDSNRIPDISFLFAAC